MVCVCVRWRLGHSPVESVQPERPASVIHWRPGVTTPAAAPAGVAHAGQTGRRMRQRGHAHGRGAGGSGGSLLHEGAARQVQPAKRLQRQG